MVDRVQRLLHRRDQRGRAEHDIAGGEDEPAAVALHHVLLRQETRLTVVLVLPALDVDIGPDELKQPNRGRLGVDRHPVHTVQGGQVLRPQLLGDQRPAGPLVDHRVAGDGDEQAVAELGRVLKMADVAGVNDVETPVTKDDRLPMVLSRPDERGGLRQRDELDTGHVELHRRSAADGRSFHGADAAISRRSRRTSLNWTSRSATRRCAQSTCGIASGRMPTSAHLSKK